MRARAEVIALLALASACTHGPLRPAAYVRNGGIGPRIAACEDVALRIEPEAVRALGPRAPGCGEDAALLASDAGAAWAYVQTETAAAPTGPIVSSPVELGLLALVAGADQRGLDDGAADRRLAGGGDERGLAGGGDERGLDAGANERGLDAGGNERRLDAGGNERGLAAGANDRGLEAGANERVPFALRKRVSRQAVGEGDEVEFALVFVNDGSARVDRVVIVDRVDARLRVLDAPGARPFVLDDGSTLLVWDDRTPLAAGAQLRVSFSAVLDLARRLDGACGGDACGAARRARPHPANGSASRPRREPRSARIGRARHRRRRVTAVTCPGRPTS